MDMGFRHSAAENEPKEVEETFGDFDTPKSELIALGIMDKNGHLLARPNGGYFVDLADAFEEQERLQRLQGYGSVAMESEHGSINSGFGNEKPQPSPEQIAEINDPGSSDTYRV